MRWGWWETVATTTTVGSWSECQSTYKHRQTVTGAGIEESAVGSGPGKAARGNKRVAL